MHGFVDSGERFFGGPVQPIAAQEAAHDYAHEGYYFRIVRISNGEWAVFLRWGRVRLPACCKPKKRTYVDEEQPEETWEARGGPSLRRRASSVG